MKIFKKLMLSCCVLGFGLGMAHAEKAEIYKLMPDTSLIGLQDPEMPDRTDVKKAWPKTPADKNNIKIGWANISLANPFFVELVKGAERTAKLHNLDIDVQIADSDVQRQCSQIDTFITLQKDIIVVDPTDTLAISNCINRAVDAGIPVVTIGAVPDERARVLTTITPNPYENGFGAGQYIAREAGKDSEIISGLIIGIVGNSTSESRLNGTVGGIVWQRMQDLGIEGTREDAMLRGYNLFQQIKKNGSFSDKELKFSALAMGEGNWTEEGGLAAAEDMISAHGSKMTHIITDNDWMALGAMRALRNAGLKDKIKVGTSADGNRIALDEIKKGNLLVTGTFSGEQEGVAAIEFVNNIFNNGLDANNLPMGSFLPAHAITPENVDEFIDPNPENKFYKFTISPVLSIPEIKAQMNK